MNLKSSLIRRDSASVAMFIYYFCGSYYTLMMWFPDLFERFSQFSSLFPGVSAGVCEVSANVTKSELFVSEQSIYIQLLNLEISL